MARNEEKAQSMLNRYITAKNEENKKPKERRPFLASECRDLSDADKWRQQIMREIGRTAADIQNEGLDEHRLRDLNDEINKLIREKGHWERRIIDLGGQNYTRHSAKMTDLDGNIVDVPNPSGRGPGYRYFGAAKKLSGVRELFEKSLELRKRRSRHSAKMTDLDENIVDVPNPSGRDPGYRYFGAAKKLPGVRELFEKPPELRKRSRQQIMREIGRKVVDIQNEGLGEHRLRDLNDEINKLIREKGHWERQIIDLGGQNYTRHSAKMTDLDGNIVDVPNPSGRGPGYRYFGAAKKLSGVRELFEKPPELRKRRS
ncbi:hypothetical protein IFM89_037964, partial [Coptis chinensis]